jgi:ribosomal silencing factor RsfS
MELTIKEKKLYKLHIDDVEMDEWLVIDYNATYFISTSLK